MMKFNKLFTSVTKEQTKELIAGEVKKLKHIIAERKKVHSGYKKGDIGLTKEGLVELCNRVKIFSSDLIGTKNHKSDEQEYILFENTTNENELKLLQLNNQIKFPCILGVADQAFLEQLEHLKSLSLTEVIEKQAQWKSFNFLQHWIFMPTKNELWTYASKWEKSKKIIVKSTTKGINKILEERKEIIKEYNKKLPKQKKMQELQKKMQELQNEMQEKQERRRRMQELQNEMQEKQEEMERQEILLEIQKRRRRMQKERAKGQSIQGIDRKMEIQEIDRKIQIQEMEMQEIIQKRQERIQERLGGIMIEVNILNENKNCSIPFHSGNFYLTEECVLLKKPK